MRSNLTTMPASLPRRRRVPPWRAGGTPLLTILCAVALALALDTALLWWQPPTATSGETAHTWPIALHLAHGRGYTACFHGYFPFCRPGNDATAQREPIPVLLFAGVAWLTGDSLPAAVLVNIGVQLATLLALCWLADMVAGRRAAQVAAVLWASYLPAIKLVESVSGDLLAALWVVLALGMLVRALRRGRWHDWVGAGGFLALAALSRSALLTLGAIFVAAALLAAWRARRELRRPWFSALRPLALLVLALALPIAPWALRNQVAFGRPVLGSTLVGYNLFRENYQLHSRSFLHYVDAPEASRAIERLLARRPELRGTENEAQLDSVYTRAALHAIEDNPRRYALLSAYRGLMLWFDVGVDPTDRTGNGLLGALVVGQQATLLALAVAGAWWRWRRVWPLVASIILVSAVYMAVIAMVRFLLPVMPLTIVLSAIGAEHLWRRARPG